MRCGCSARMSAIPTTVGIASVNSDSAATRRKRHSDESAALARTTEKRRLPPATGTCRRNPARNPALQSFGQPTRACPALSGIRGNGATLTAPRRVAASPKPAWTTVAQCNAHWVTGNGACSGSASPLCGAAGDKCRLPMFGARGTACGGRMPKWPRMLGWRRRGCSWGCCATRLPRYPTSSKRQTATSIDEQSTATIGG